MAFVKAEILTPWEQVEEDGEISRRPLLSSQFELRKWQDITGQPSGRLMLMPNMVSVLTEIEEGTLSVVRSDSRFVVIWDEVIELPSRVLSQGQFNALRNALAGRFGFTSEQLDVAIGARANGRTIVQIIQELRFWKKAN